MRNTLIISSVLFLLGAGCAAQTATSKPVIAVTGRPLYDAAVAVAGTNADVKIASTSADFKGVDVIFAIGHGFDDWSSQAQVPRTVVNVGVTDQKIAADGTPDDPHYWLTLPNMRVIASNISADLEKRFPDKAPVFRGNLKGYQDTLDEADGHVRANLTGLKNNVIITIGDSWRYFAAAYGLEVAYAFPQTAADEEPTEEYFHLLSEVTKKTGTKVLFTEPGLKMPALEAYAKEHGMSLVPLDSMQSPGGLPYPEAMIRNSELIRDNR